MHSSIVFEVFWEAFGKPWALENHAKMYNYMYFQGLDPFFVRSVCRDLLLEGVWHLCQILVPIGTPVLPLLLAFSASGFAVGF